MRLLADAQPRTLTLVWVALVLNAIVLKADSSHAAEWDRQPRPTADPVSAASLFPWGADFTSPDEIGLVAETVHFQNRQGTQLRGWHFAADHSTHSILFCMGNSGNISLMLPYARILQHGGFDVLLFDYSGFGKSEGTASVVTLLDDTHAAFDYLLTRTQRTAEHIGIFGVSLGSIPALTVAADRGPGAVALEDVFVPEHEIDRWLPHRAELPLIERMALRSLETLLLPAVDPRRNASRLSCPLFLMHGVDDKLLPPEGSLTVAECAISPTRVWLMDDTGHAPDSLEVNDHEYADQLVTFFRQAFARELRQLNILFSSESTDDHHIVTARLDDISVDTAANADTAEAPANSDDGAPGYREPHSDGHVPVPVEIMFASRTGQFHCERRLLTPGDSFQLRLPFAPTDAFAVRAWHATAMDDQTWQPNYSEYSKARAELQQRLVQLFSDSAHAKMFTEDRGRYFYNQRLQNRLPILHGEAVQEILEALREPDQIPERLRPRYARLLARLQCWPDDRCGIPQHHRSLECAELMLKYCPVDNNRYYELGNARMDLGFADSAVGDALYRLAKSRLADGNVQQAQDLLRHHIQVLPRDVPTSLTDDRIQRIHTAGDLESVTAP